MSRDLYDSVIYGQQFSPAQNAGLPEGPGTPRDAGQKKRVPSGLLSAPADPLAAVEIHG